MKYRDPSTGEFKELYVKAADTLPVGTIVDFDGDEVPAGWEEAGSDDYSTEETFTGKYWIDGKKIYRKVYNVGNLPDANTMTVESGMLWKDVEVINIYGYGRDASNGVVFPMNFCNPISIANSIGLRLSGDSTIFIVTGDNKSTLIGYVTIEYTKTTD